MVCFILIFCQILNFLTFFLIFSFSEPDSKESKNRFFFNKQKVYWYLLSVFGKGNDHFLLQRIKEVYIFVHELINTLFISVFTKRVTLVNDVHKTCNFLVRPRGRFWSISEVPRCIVGIEYRLGSLKLNWAWHNSSLACQLFRHIRSQWLGYTVQLAKINLFLRQYEFVFQCFT